jgi:uncharacterized protein (DUF736 family)
MVTGQLRGMSIFLMLKLIQKIEKKARKFRAPSLKLPSPVSRIHDAYRKQDKHSADYVGP